MTHLFWKFDMLFAACTMLCLIAVWQVSTACDPKEARAQHSPVLENSNTTTEYIYDARLELCFIRQTAWRTSALTYVPCTKGFKRLSGHQNKTE